MTTMGASTRPPAGTATALGGCGELTLVPPALRRGVDVAVVPA